MKTEVFISGAGPSGLLMACLLTKYGVTFRIIDKKRMFHLIPELWSYTPMPLRYLKCWGLNRK
ncbi:MAG: NAD(P)-binding protein [Bacteroidales bacterium]|nr:NAD(P)-binding protein [Bacteroidales bacterium]